MSRKVSGTNKTKKKFSSIFFIEIYVVCPPWGGESAEKIPDPYGP